MKRFYTLVLLNALSIAATAVAQTNEATPARPLEQLAALSSINELASLADDELIVFVNGKQLEGAEKKTTLDDWRKISATMLPLGGIGTQVAVKDGKIVIVKALRDSPALKAGLIQGDVIAAINDEAITGLPLQEVVMRLRGEVGSKVTISIARPGLAQHFDVQLTREEIKHRPEPEPGTGKSILVLRKDAVRPEELERILRSVPKYTPQVDSKER